MDEIKEQELLTDFLIEQLCSRASGRYYEECSGFIPRDRFFIGNLKPIDEKAESQRDQRYSTEQSNKIAPVAFGGDFNLAFEENSGKILVKLEWSCFYKVFPSYAEQHRHQFPQQPLKDVEEEDDQSITAITRRREYPFNKYKKIRCAAFGYIHLSLDNNTWTVDSSEFENAIFNEIERAKSIALSDPNRIKASRGMDDGFTIPDVALTDEGTYQDFIKTLHTEVTPDWGWRVNFDLSPNMEHPEDGRVIFSFEFANASQAPPNSPNREGFFFEPKATFLFEDCMVFPFRVDLKARTFRYEQNIWARGFNCGIIPVFEDSPKRKVFQTTAVPIYNQKRYRTKVLPKASFQQLAQDPIPTLEKICNSMNEYLTTWECVEEQYKIKFPNWDSKYKSEYDADRETFYNEILRFKEGIDLIKRYPDIQLAFKLTNEVFYQTGQKSTPKKEDWRLFQVVFLVSQIPDIACLDNSLNLNPERRNYVDIIYFPTGGGKTEAYLSVIIFHAFFDRLRGKQAGCTAWLRFSLRLLTLQQTQRVADIIGNAELIRRRHNDPRLSGPNVDKFSVGYFVGQSSTPNEIVKPDKYTYIPDPNWLKAQNNEERQNWKMIIRCPACGLRSITVDFDPQSIKVIHRCTNPQCEFEGGEIPIYIVDSEIYRYLPTVIVGTIDKLASLGNQRKLSLVFGKVDGTCSLHGYYNGTKCTQKGCQNRSLSRDVPNGISGPTLFIQDELHLIKEGLGTFDSHYETFAQRLLQEFGSNVPLKIIASSATIEAFERQVEHLYGRNRNYARIFPGFGPTLYDSFYAETLPIIQRRYVGILPHNKTITRSVLELIQYYHETIENLSSLSNGSPNPYGGCILPGTNEWLCLIDNYKVSLNYFLKTKVLDRINTDINNVINPDLRSKSFNPINVVELAGGTTTEDVTKILDKLETCQPSGEDLVHAVLATSMVSHGVDISRLNTMIFHGMPRQNAEYIQASSRVGRSHVGIVIDCFDPIRERDRSHYTYFQKYHEFIGQLVEPAAINRWSKFSIERTLPGLFMGVILQLIATRQNNDNPNLYYMLSFIKQKIDQGVITPDIIIPFLENSYLINEEPGSQRSATIKEKIEYLVNHYFDCIHNAQPSPNEGQFVSGALIPAPLTSLRDVDEQIVIDLDPDGLNWKRISRRVHN